MNFFHWLESTALAREVGGSQLLTAWLSAIHAVGFTVVMSGAIASNLQAAALVFRRPENVPQARGCLRLLAFGLATSVLTGVPLFAARASQLAGTGAFQAKMLLLGAALVFQLVVLPRSRRSGGLESPGSRAPGIGGVLIWLSVALSACWFLLFE